MEFFNVLVRYETALWNAVDDELKRRGLVNLGQLHALGMIESYEGQARVQELSDVIGITVGATSKLVDRLERDGLAARTPNPANRRSSLLTLTTPGREALVAGSAVLRGAVEHAVGDEDVQQLSAVLERLLQRLHRFGVRNAA